MSNNKEILEQACNWLSQINSTQEYDAIAFSEWLSCNDEHLQVFNEVSENWQLLTLINSPATPLSIVPKETNNVRQSKPFRSWFAIAASAILVFVTQLYLFNHVDEKSYVSKVGEYKEFTLDDGSKVALNAQTKFKTSFSRNKRLLVLEQGDAHFIVARDPQRPFIVTYNQHTFTALGTAFSITTRPQLSILVTEHNVAVKTEKNNAIVNEAEALIYHNNWQSLPLIKAKQKMAWQQGKIVFDQEPLHQVLAQLTPYLKKPIQLINLSVRNEAVTGNFELAQAEQALNMIALGLDLKIRNSDNKIMLY